MKKILVAYFSASGKTRKTAEMLAKAAGADLYEIKPEIPYTTADLNWRDEQARSTLEMKDKSSRPALADKNADIASYDTIFLGFPVWWYVAPTLINSFLEAYDFSGKKIILFATSGGSGFGKTVEGLKGSVAADATLVEGKLLNGPLAEAELKQWIDTVL
jgi:flavodoxin